MATIENCLMCKYYQANANICGQTSRVPLFDNTFCPLYHEVSNSDELAIRQQKLDTMEKSPHSKREVSDEMEIRGWLSFFISVILGLGGVGYSIYLLIQMLLVFSLDNLDLVIKRYDATSVYTFLYLSILVLLLNIVWLSYTIIAFRLFKPKAVVLCKYLFLTNMMVLVITFIMDSFKVDGDSPFFSIFSFIGLLIWYAYLNNSTQVETLFPKAERKLKVGDKIYIGINMVITIGANIVLNQISIPRF